MLQFKKQVQVFEADFEDFKLELPINDETLGKFEESKQKLIAGSKQFENGTGEELKKLKEMTEHAFDSLFGLGVFAEVYKFSGESTLKVCAIFLEIVGAIEQEYVKQSETDYLKKYLKND